MKVDIDQMGWVDDIILKKLLLVIQANQSGSSNAMELDGAKQCFQYLADKDVKVSSFISDCCKGIAKLIRETQPNVQHYNDVWHVSKSLNQEASKSKQGKG